MTYLYLNAKNIKRQIYDSMFWGRNESYTGTNRPLLIAYEEAHSYLGKNDNTQYAKVAVERIFKEGRKFGVGAMVISQRPCELSETILHKTTDEIKQRIKEWIKNYINEYYKDIEKIEKIFGVIATFFQEIERNIS